MQANERPSSQIKNPSFYWKIYMKFLYLHFSHLEVTPFLQHAQHIERCFKIVFFKYVT